MNKVKEHTIWSVAPMSMTQLLSVNVVLLKTLDEKNTMRMIITREVAGLRDYTSCLMV